MLMINDLAFEMDSTAMAQVRGGRLPQPMMDLIATIHDGTHPNSNSNPNLDPTGFSLLVPVSPGINLHGT